MTDAFADADDRVMTDHHWDTLQAILDAMMDMPDVACRINDYLRGRGSPDPENDILVLDELAR